LVEAVGGVEAGRGEADVDAAGCGGQIEHGRLGAGLGDDGDADAAGGCGEVKHVKEVVGARDGGGGFMLAVGARGGGDGDAGVGWACVRGGKVGLW